MLAEEGAPRIIPFGPKMVGPVIYTFGTDEQKERFLPGIRSPTVSWCQGYSEPGAGSDLASCAPKRCDEGDHYIVNGQKTWTSFAHWGDWIFCLVRTNPDAKPQEGISFLLIDMKTPGITVRPIIMLDGAHHVNDVFLDNVPRAGRQPHRQGRRGLDLRQVPAGQRAAGHRRGAVLQARRALAARHRPRRAGERRHHGRRSGFRRADRRPRPAGPGAGDERASGPLDHGAGRRAGTGGFDPQDPRLGIQQRITELTMEAVGEYAAPYQPGMLFQDTNETPVGPDHAPPAAPRYFNFRKTSIYGGSNEIQKNIVSKMVLGL